MTEIDTDYQPLHKAILAIKRDVGKMQKDTPIEASSGRNYSVVGYEQIIEKLQPFFLKYGINVYPSVVESHSWDTYRERNDNGILVRTRETHFAKVVVDYLIEDTTGVSRTVRMVGESENDNDKSMSAALSFSWKYFAKQTFDLVTGDPDPDTQGSTVKQADRQAEMHTTTRPANGGAEVVANTPPPAPTPQSQPVLERAVENNQGASTPTGEAISSSQASLISVILTGKKNPDYPNNQGMSQGVAYDFVEGVVGRPMDRSVHYTKKFQELTKDEGKRVMDAIKQIPGVVLQDRPRN
jgi:ERF superfamily